VPSTARSLPTNKLHSYESSWETRPLTQPYVPEQLNWQKPGTITGLSIRIFIVNSIGLDSISACSANTGGHIFFPFLTRSVFQNLKKKSNYDKGSIMLFENVHSICTAESCINPLKKKRKPLYLETQSVLCCKHFSSKLYKPINLCCKWHKSLFVLR